jgi:hypothetical protein
VFGAAEDCPTKLTALTMHARVFETEQALVGYLSPRLRDCLTKDQIPDIASAVIHNNQHCAEALPIAGLLWPMARRGSLPPSQYSSGVALSMPQVQVLEMALSCSQDAKDFAFADPKDVAEFVRFQQDGEQRQAAVERQQRSGEACMSSCTQAYGEPDGTCRVTCRQLGGDSSCFRRCADDGQACFAGCGK